MNTRIDDWKTTKWKDINVEQMDIDCKKFAKEVRSLDKEMKAWDAFVGLDNTVKNMITSLRAVSELQNPAIRDRHWQQLMQATQVWSQPAPGRVWWAAWHLILSEADGDSPSQQTVTPRSHTDASDPERQNPTPVLQAAETERTGCALSGEGKIIFPCAQLRSSVS